MGGKELQDLVSQLRSVVEEYGLSINVYKTKVMVLGNGECNITLNGVKLERVSTFTYLGAVITDDTECVGDIKNRIAKGRGQL